MSKASLFLLTSCLPLCSYGEFFSLVDARWLVEQPQESSWLSGDLGPSRFDGTSDIAIGQALIGIKASLPKNLSIHGFISAYDDGGESFGVNELYLKYRPLPVGGYRFQTRIGAYFPSISLENTQPGWTSRSTLTNSAINSWIGEEVKPVGIEAKVIRPGKFHFSDWDSSITLSLFSHHDLAGALLAWRGWAMHDRQVRIGESIRFAELPSIADGEVFEEQDPEFDAHVEVDNNLGGSISGGLKHSSGIKFKAYYYNNFGDPNIIEKGQYSWQTSFRQLSVQWPVSRHLLLSSQWLTGRTFMGEGREGSVSARFAAWFLLADYTWKKWGAALRYDDFSVENLDLTPHDNNDQAGDAWTFAVRFKPVENVTFIAEYLLFDEKNYARGYFGLMQHNRVRQSQLAVQWRY